jgi:Na+-transporting NADH:ubiquinone oxidoreductase subunit A
MIKIKKGLNLPIGGLPSSEIDETKTTATVAVLGPDYVGIKPSMMVAEGDKVQVGQPLFSCKKTQGVVFTAPGAGVVKNIKRGLKRALQYVEIELDKSEDEVSYKNYPNDGKSAESVKSLLLESGLWTALRRRPFSMVADPSEAPLALFINAMDTNPLSGDPQVIIDRFKDEFADGVNILSTLTDGKVHLCTASTQNIFGEFASNVEVNKFSGVHPAGLVGTHIHFLRPVDANHMVWHINYQDVIAVGKLFKTGKLWCDRFISLAGPAADKPRVIKLRLGHDLNKLAESEIDENQEKVRVVSGSVLSGRKIESDNIHFLGRYHNQVTLLEEGGEREFFGWHHLGFDKFSVMRTYISSYLPSGKLFNFNTMLAGSLRAIVPIGAYEKVMPLNILATPLLKSLLSHDSDAAQKLGLLELDEEDLALINFVSPSKIDYTKLLRESLNIIEKEG